MGKKIPLELAEKSAAVKNGANDSIFTKPNKYGYMINVNHPKIRPIYERYKRKIGCQILSDKERFDFEAFIIRKYTESMRGKNNMKVYRITLKNNNGEPLYITVTASSLYEAMKKVSFGAGWHFAEYSVIGGVK